MKTKEAGPQTLLEAVVYFADADVAHAFVAALRWPNGVTCPECDSPEVAFLAKRKVWNCRGCRKQFSAKVGTLFEDSPIPLTKWLPAVWLIVNCKNGISSYELARDLKVTQKTAWFMLHRIRVAMRAKSFGKMGGTTEMDETFIGGRAINMHKEKRKRVITSNGVAGKAVVFGLLERHGRNKHSTVRATVIPNRQADSLHPVIRENVETGTQLYSDAWMAYRSIGTDYAHAFVDHTEKYVEGQIHTNGLENFWSLLKRSIKGTYVSVEPFHLFRYVDEQVYRFNARKLDDAGRFLQAAANIIGQRLTYRDLTGQEAPSA